MSRPPAEAASLRRECGGDPPPAGPDQLPRHRAAVDAPPRSGQELEAVTARLTDAGFTLAGDRVATRPELVEHVPADRRAVRRLVTWLSEAPGGTTRPRGR